METVLDKFEKFEILTSEYFYHSLNRDQSDIIFNKSFDWLINLINYLINNWSGSWLG